MVRCLVLALSACGRVGFGAPPDAAADRDGAEPDADPFAILAEPFSAPVALPGVNSAQSDDDPTLTGDLLELFFDSSRPGGGGSGMGDVWHASRASISSGFGAPTLVAALVSPADDTTPDLSPDGLRLYLASDRAAQGDRDLYVATRAARGDPFGAPARIAELASDSDDNGACESADGLRLLFSSERAGGKDVYETSRAAIGSPWSQPVPVMNLSDASRIEYQHWCNPELTVVYFTSGPTTNDGDIYLATRPSAGMAFGAPAAVAELSDPSVDESDQWVSPDLRTIIFARDQGGQLDLYLATR